MHTLYAVCAPGLEEATEAELKELGVQVGSVGTGGVGFVASDAQAARIHLDLRTVVRVLRRLGSFTATDKSALRDRLQGLDFAGAVFGGVKATARKSRIHHTGLLEEVVREVAPISEDGAAPLLRLRMERDVCTVSVAVGGERLDHRGWRTDVGPAPLRESVAAAILRVAGWDRVVPLIDPLCGSGVIPLEAADWARREGRTPSPSVTGSDARAEAIAAAGEHAAAAGLGDAITWAVSDLSSWSPSGPAGLVVCNPPWGKRMDVGEVYAELGRRLRGLKGWRAAVITPRAAPRAAGGGDGAADLEGTLGRGPQRVVPFRHGGAPVALRIYERLGVRARSRRRPAGRRRPPADRS